MRLILFTLLAALVACASQPEPTATPTLVAVVPTSTPTSAAVAVEPTEVSPTVTPEPTPTETPVVPLIELADQTIGDDGIVQIARLVSAESGWLTLTSSNVELITFPVVAGETPNLEVTVDPLLIGSTLTARLFTGGGETFDPAVNQPATTEAGPVETTAAVTLEITKPQVVMLKQEVFDDGIVIAESIVAAEPGWLAIHNDDDGELGEVVGFYIVREAGVYARVPIHILWRLATPTLHAVLYGDEGQIGRFEPQSDPVVRVQDNIVQATFEASYPPDIFILDQPVISNTVVIERVISDGPGWLTIMFETDEETPGNVIGFAPLQDGVNEYVSVELVAGAATEVLYAQLHADDTEIGVFDFPAGDLPVQYNDQLYTFPFRTDEGNYVISTDQQIHYEGGIATVNVPMAVADLDVWVVIRAELAPGALGDVLGYEWRSAGIHRDITVEIDAENTTPTLYATLHIDRDALQVFEFPEGRDYELQRQRAPIAAPFAVLP